MKEDFDKMLSHYEKPSKVILDVISYENAHRSQFLNSYTGFIANFEHAFELLCELVQIVNYINKDLDKFPTHRTLQWVIIKNNIGTFYSSFHRLSSGFGIDAMVLIRGLFESIIRIYFISYYPESKEAVFGYINGVTNNKTEFKLTRFIETELKKDWKGQYRLLSTFAHSNMFDSMKDLRKFNTEDQKELYTFGIGWNKDLNEMGINYLSFILWNYFFFIKEIVFHEFHIDEISKKYPSLYQNLLDTEKAFSLLASGAGNSNPLLGFRDMHKETLEIIKEIKSKEKLPSSLHK